MYTQVSLGMRFRMMFETEESGVRRYMGTITGISDMDSVRWKNSQWRNLQVLLINYTKLKLYNSCYMERNTSIVRGCEILHWLLGRRTKHPL